MFTSDSENYSDVTYIVSKLSKYINPVHFFEFDANGCPKGAMKIISREGTF